MATSDPNSETVLEDGVVVTRPKKGRPRSVYDMGTGGIGIVEAALIKEKAEHQAFRQAVAAALDALRASWKGRADYLRGYGEQLKDDVYSERAQEIYERLEEFTATISALGLSVPTAKEKSE